MSAEIYEVGLGKTAANFTALTPLKFIERTATVYPLQLHTARPTSQASKYRVQWFCELPKTSTGKIQKFELRKWARSVAAIDV